MFLFSKSARRATTLAAMIMVLTLLLTACGANGGGTGSSNTPAATNTTAPSNCSVSTADLGPGGTSKATAPNDNATGTIVISGSSALQPLVKQAATEYQAANPGANITVNAGGSGKGLSDVESGASQIGDSDLFYQDVNASGYADLQDNQVAVVIFAVVVNPDVAAKITNLTTQQIQQIFGGQVSNWSQLGGPNEAITTIERPNGSGTRGTFSKYVMQGMPSMPTTTLQKDDSGALGQAVSTTPGPIGYIATSFIGNGGAYQGKIDALCIDGYKPSPTDVASNNYKFWNFEHMYTKGAPSGLAASFLNYIKSSAFQQADVPSLYFMSADQLSASAKQSHQPSA